MTSLTLLNENTFDDVYATTVHTDNIEVNDASEISVNDVMNFTVLPELQGTGIQQYIRESLTVTGALSYSTNQGLLRGITIDNYNRDVILSLSGTTVLSADLTSGTGQSLVLYMNYSQTVGSNKALAITPTNTSQTILSTSIPGNTTSLIATFEILQATLNQTFVPSGIFDINLFTAESNANDGLEVYAELYTVSSLGVETLFATTDQIEVIEQYPEYGETTLSAVNVEQEALEIGGAFRMKIYGVNSRGSAHTLYTYYEGTGSGYSHLHTPFNVALAGGYWSENGTTVYLTNTGNNVAIGKTSATERLEVSGNILTNDIYGLNASFTNGFYNNLSGLSISGTDIKCDTATFTNGNILGLTANNLNANNLTVVSSSTFNGAFTVATSASFNAGISVGQSSTFIGEVLVGSGNSTSFFVGGRTTIGNNGLRLHTPLGANINTFVDTKQPAGGSLVFRLDDTLGATERMRLSQSGLSVGTSNMSQRLVVNGNVLVNNNQPITTASSQGMYMTWSRSSPINPVQGGDFGSRGISFLLNQRGSGPGGICLGEVGLDNSVTFNAFLDPSGSLFLRGALIASGGRSQVFDLNVSGGASFNNIQTLNITGTNARLLNMSGTNIEYTTATFNDMRVASATFGNISGLNATFTNLALNSLSISNLNILGLSANAIDASFIYATFIQSFTFNGFNLTITGRDFNNTSGIVQGRFDAGYMPDGNYVQLAGTRASFAPGTDGDSVISFYSKNAVPTSDAFFSTRLTSQGGDPNSAGDGRFTIRSGSLQFQQGGVRMLTMTGGFSTSFNTNLNISGALSLSGPLVVSSNATFLSGLVVNGSATLNTMTMLSLTGTNGRITTISGTNLEYTTGTFNALNVVGLTANNITTLSITGTNGRIITMSGTNLHYTTATFGALTVAGSSTMNGRVLITGGNPLVINNNLIVFTANTNAVERAQGIEWYALNGSGGIYQGQLYGGSSIDIKLGTYNTAYFYQGGVQLNANVDITGGLNVVGSSTFNALAIGGATFTSISVGNITGTNAGFNEINITGQYSRLGLTLNASAPMAYSITFNRFSMSQVDDVGTDGYLSSAQYDALASSATIWTEDGPNKNIYPQSNDRNLLLYNTDVSGSPAVRDTGVNWRRTTLSGDLNHFLRIRTGGAKDGYLIHQTQNSAPFQLCAGSVQPALLLGGTFNDLIDANTAFQIRTFQNNTPTLMKLQMSGVASSSNYCEIELQDPTNDISFRTAGNSENLLIRDNTRSINRIQITPSTLSHAGTIATLASSGNNRVDIGNAGNGGQFIDFNVGVANDFDARIICGLGTTGTNGRGNVDLWGNRFTFVVPNGAGARTVVDTNGCLGVNFTPTSAGNALTISGSFQIFSNGSGGSVDSISFNRGRTALATTGGDFLGAINFNGRRQSDNAINRGAYINCLQITSSTSSVAGRIDIGARNSSGTEGSVMSIETTGVGIGTTLTARVAPFYVSSLANTGEDQIVAYNTSNIGNTTKGAGFGFHHLNNTGTNFRTGSIRTIPSNTTIDQSRMTFGVLAGSTSTITNVLTISGSTAINMETNGVSIGTGLTVPTQALEISGTAYARRNASTGFDAFACGNISNANNTTKFSQIKWNGTDTVGTLKNVGAIRYAPNEADWLSSITRILGRRADVADFETVRIEHSTQDVTICPDGTAFTNPSLFLNGKTSSGQPGVRFHYAGGSGGYFDLRGGTSAHRWHWRGDTGSSTTLLMTLDFAGDLNVANYIACALGPAVGIDDVYMSAGGLLCEIISDIRTKRDIEPINDVDLERVWNSIHPAKYFFKTEVSNPINPRTGQRRKWWGLIANDLDPEIQTMKPNTRVELCKRCQMKCSHPSSCECEEYNTMECECDQFETIDAFNYNSRDLMGVMIARMKQQERVIENMKEELVKERIQFKVMEDRQNKRIGKLEQALATLINKLEVQGMRTK